MLFIGNSSRLAGSRNSQVTLIGQMRNLSIFSCLQYFEYDLKPDRAFVSTAGEPTNMVPSLYESSITNKSHIHSAPPVIELGLGSRSSVQQDFSSQPRSSSMLAP
jgi:hypothetical protein